MKDVTTFLVPLPGYPVRPDYERAWPELASAYDEGKAGYFEVWIRRHSTGIFMVHGALDAFEREDSAALGILALEAASIASALRAIVAGIEAPENLVEECLAELPDDLSWVGMTGCGRE